MAKKQPLRLDLSPFPRLTWDSYFWTGQLTLKTWAKFQPRRGVDDEAKSAWLGPIHVAVPDATYPPHPTPEQCAACQHLFDNERAIRKNVLAEILANYPQWREEYREDYDLTRRELARSLPTIRSATALCGVVELSHIHVLKESLVGVAYLGFEFRCEWEREHGLGVMTHQGRIVSVGHAAESFMGWIAERDAAEHRKRKK